MSSSELVRVAILIGYGGLFVLAAYATVTMHDTGRRMIVGGFTVASSAWIAFYAASLITDLTDATVVDRAVLASRLGHIPTIGALVGATLIVIDRDREVSRMRTVVDSLGGECDDNRRDSTRSVSYGSPDIRSVYDGRPSSAGSGTNG